MREYCHNAGVNFSHMARDDRFAEIEKLADRLMAGIKQIVPVLPISLVATVIKEDGPCGLSAFEVEARVNRLITRLQAKGAPVYVSAEGRVETILNALNMLQIRRLVVESQGIYQSAPGEDDMLGYYANSIAHWMPEKIE
jgi:glycerol-3-phosphate O-acyltransferase